MGFDPKGQCFAHYRKFHLLAGNVELHILCGTKYYDNDIIGDEEKKMI